MDFKGDKNRVWSVGLKYDSRGNTFMRSIKVLSTPGRRFMVTDRFIRSLPTGSEYLFIGPDGVFWLEDILSIRKGSELLVQIN